MIEVDGSYGEGGGQILRTCCTLSAVTGTPVRVTNVRAGRERPGLRPQHLAAISAAGMVCEATIRGGHIGSTELLFEPGGPVSPGDYAFDIGTAGSTTLVLQTVLPALALTGKKSTVQVTGGTHNPFAPTTDYLEQLYVPTAKSFGWDFEMRTERAGFYPAGGGMTTVKVGAGKREPISLLDAEPFEGPCFGVVTYANLPDAVGDRGAKAFRGQFGGKCQVRKVEATSPGFAVGAFFGEPVLAGYTALGQKGVSAEAVVAGLADECDQARKEGFGGVDEYLGDQLAVLAALTPGESTWQVNKVSEHLRTVLWLVAEFGAEVAEWDEGSGLVRVVGLG